MKINNEHDIEKEFVEYLKNNGYPINKIQLNRDIRYKSYKKFDVIVFGKDNITPLIAFEIKNKDNLNNYLIKKYNQEANKIEFYFYIAERENNTFAFYDMCNCDKIQDIKKYKKELPSYDILNLTTNRINLSIAKSELKNKGISLIVSCCIVSSIQMFFLILNICNVFSFDSNRMILLIISTLLLIVPFINEIKIANFLYIKTKENIENDKDYDNK